MLDRVTKELISAYIDDEVSSDERDAVQRALAGSAEDRQFYDELQSQRALIQQLPRLQLPDSFSERVVQEATRRASIGLGGSAASPVKWQTLAWAALAIAALLVITALLGRLPSPGPQDNIARPSEVPSETVPGETELVDDSSDSFPEDQIAAGDTGSLVYYVPDSDRRPRISLVIDVAMTPAAQRDGAFADVLAKTGIKFDPQLTIEDDLTKSVLESRFLANVEVVGDGGEAGDEVEITYMVCENQRVDEIYRRLKDRENEFPSTNLDLIVQPEDLNILFQLNDASRKRFAQRIDSPRKRTLAHRLVFNVSLRSSSLGFLGKVSGPSIRAELVPAEEAAEQIQMPFFIPRLVAEPKPPAADQVQKTAAREAAPGRAGKVEALQMQQSEIVFLLRKLKADVEALRGQ
jgi:hypothetical protein